jgi:hypothetical protein
VPISIDASARPAEYLKAFETRFCTIWTSIVASPTTAGRGPIVTLASL